MGDISKRLKLKEDLKCKDMKWFMREVMESSVFPNEYAYVGDVSTNIVKLETWQITKMISKCAVMLLGSWYQMLEFFSCKLF